MIEGHEINLFTWWIIWRSLICFVSYDSPTLKSHSQWVYYDIRKDPLGAVSMARRINVLRIWDLTSVWRLWVQLPHGAWRIYCIICGLYAFLCAGACIQEYIFFIWFTHSEMPWDLSTWCSVFSMVISNHTFICFMFAIAHVFVTHVIPCHVIFLFIQLSFQVKPHQFRCSLYLPIALINPIKYCMRPISNPWLLMPWCLGCQVISIHATDYAEWRVSSRNNSWGVVGYSCEQKSKYCFKGKSLYQMSVIIKCVPPHRYHHDIYIDES